MRVHKPHNPKIEERPEKTKAPEVLQMTAQGEIKPQQESLKHLSMDSPKKIIPPLKKSWFSKPQVPNEANVTSLYSYIEHLLTESGNNKLVQFKNS